MEPKKKKVLLVDPVSYTLPFDVAFSDFYFNDDEVDFVCSSTRYNFELLDDSRFKKIKQFKVSDNFFIFGVFEYLRLLFYVFFKTNRYDYVFFQWPKLWPLDLLLFVRKNVFYIMHNDIPHNHDKPILFHKIISKLKCRLVFVSEFTMKRFIKNYGKPKSVISCLPHPRMKPSEVYRGFELKSNSRDEIDICLIGNVKPYKGIEFVESILDDSRSTNLKFKILGKWDQSLKPLKEKFLRNDKVFILDKFLTNEEFELELKKEQIFILPHDKMTQSGLLYSFLGAGSLFISNSVGDSRWFCKKFLRDTNLYSSKDEFFKNLQDLQRSLVAERQNIESAALEYDLFSRAKFKKFIEYHEE